MAAFTVALYIRFTLYDQLYPDAIIFETYFIDFSYLGEQYALSFNLDAICGNPRGVRRQSGSFLNPVALPWDA